MLATLLFKQVKDIPIKKTCIEVLGHVSRMEDGRIPKDILYGELASGKRNSGRPQLRFKVACKMDMKALDIHMETWKNRASNRSNWRSTLRTQLLAGEKVLAEKAAEKRTCRKDAMRTDKHTTVTAHTCSSCGKDCHRPRSNGSNNH